MPGNHSEWAFRIPAAKIPRSPTGAWQVYAVVRIEPNVAAKLDSMAFFAGVYDNAAKDYPANAKFSISEASKEFRSYLVGTFEPGADRDIFVSPAGNADASAVWVDRVVLVPRR